MTSTPDDNLPEPFFITEEIAEQMKAAGYIFEPPSHVTTTNARELFGLRPGETVAEALARQQMPKLSATESPAINPTTGYQGLTKP